MRLFLAISIIFVLYKNVFSFDSDLLMKYWKHNNKIFEKTIKLSGSSNKRFQIFKKNFVHVQSHNEKVKNKTINSKYLLGLNKFSQMTNEEISKTIQLRNYDKILKLSLKKRNYNVKSTNSYLKKLSGTIIPPYVNWVHRGKSGKVKDQGYCQGCSYFSAAAVLESVYAVKYNILRDLSTQMLIDCTFHNLTDNFGNMYDNDGCYGGFAEENFDFIIKNGIMKEKHYPYIAKNRKDFTNTGFVQSCKFDSNNTIPGFKLKKYVEYFDLPIEKIKYLVTKSPIHSYFYASDEITNYSSGLFDYPEDFVPSYMCKKLINHSVVIVGYGMDSDGDEYWIVKSSWGEDWGEDGYFRVKFGLGCIEHHITVPIF